MAPSDQLHANIYCVATATDVPAARVIATAAGLNVQVLLQGFVVGGSRAIGSCTDHLVRPWGQALEALWLQTRHFCAITRAKSTEP